jgi:hypothetical protein
MKTFACILFLALFFFVPLAYSDSKDPYESLKDLPSSDSPESLEGGPYDSLSRLPKASDERHPTLQNEYSAPEDQNQ